MLARHGARYPTTRKLNLARAAAEWMCALPSSQPKKEEEAEGGVEELQQQQEQQQQQQEEAQKWCRRMLTALEGVQGGSLNPYGEWEQRELGREIAETYFTSSSSSSSSSSLPAPSSSSSSFKPAISVKVTAKERTKQSCHAFWTGVHEVLSPSSLPTAPPSPPSLPPSSSSSSSSSSSAYPEWCEREEAEDDALLRPYATCPRVQQHRKQILEGLHDPRYAFPPSLPPSLPLLIPNLPLLPSLPRHSTIQTARLALLHSLGLSSLPPSLHPSDDLVLGVYYACQTELTLFPSSRPPSLSSSTTTSSSFACALLSSSSPSLPLSLSLLLDALETAEDKENYHTRGFGPPSSRQVTLFEFCLSSVFPSSPPPPSLPPFLSPKNGFDRALSLFSHRKITLTQVMAPFLHHLTRRMQQQQQQQQEEEGGRAGGREGRREGGLEVDLFFAHDSTLLPVVALLDLVRVGRRGGGGREGGRGRGEREGLKLDLIRVRGEGGRRGGREGGERREGWVSCFGYVDGEREGGREGGREEARKRCVFLKA